MTYPEFIALWRDESPLCPVHTSGSTGRPKQIMLPKSMMRLSALRTVAFFGLSAPDRIHSCISPDFIGGKMMAVRSEVCGLRLTWETPSNHPEIHCANPDDAPALVAVVPSQMLHVLERPDLLLMDSTIWLIGGAPIDADLRRRIAASPLKAWESYGMTETASHIALRRVDYPPQPFHPLPGIEVATDERGCLTINQPLGTTLPDGSQATERIVTNDIVDLHPDGSFTLRGRADNVIITGGRKVHPEELESRLLPLLAPLGITAVMISSLPDPKWGAAVRLIIEWPDCAGDPPMERVQEICRAALRPHEVPKSYRAIPELPRTPNGKLRRHPPA